MSSKPRNAAPEPPADGPQVTTPDPAEKPGKAAPALASLKVDRALAARFTALATLHGEDPRARLEKLILADLAGFATLPV